jgi:hypothetical protein
MHYLLPYGVSSLRPLWRLIKHDFHGPKRSLTLRDVKNEDRSDYVYENNGDDDKMSSEKHGFLQNTEAFAP